MVNLIMKIIDFFSKLPIINKIFEIPFVKKIINRETISYIYYGVLTTVVCLLSYEIIKRLLVGSGQLSQIDMNIANVLSWIIAVTFAYITNKFFVFNSKSVKIKVLIKEVLSFFGARLLSLAFEIIWMNVTVVILSINDSIAKIGAQIGIVIMNYFFSKLFIFNNTNKAR